MIPEGDRGPAWLRDYGFTDFRQIEADIQAMENFARKLAASVHDNYAPHLNTVTTAMSTRIPDPPAEFAELWSFLVTHNEIQNVSHQNVYNFANGTQSFATAASDISRQYNGSDAFAQAQVRDVDTALERVGIPASTPPGGDL